ncbi:MAG: DnaJ domain-containing protein [Cyclobacteriaceae bacterium]
MPKVRAHHLHTLGLDLNATDDQIKSAYRTLSKKYHPDVNQAVGANEQFLAIKEAYEHLSSDTTKIPLYEESTLSEEEIRQRWREDARKRAHAKSQENDRRLAELISKIVRLFRPWAVGILILNLLLAVDYFIPLTNHNERILEVNKVYEHSSSSRYAGRNGYYRYDEIVFENFRMTFDKGEVILLDLSPHAIVAATTIFGTPMYTQVTSASKSYQLAPIFNIYFIFGYLIPAMMFMGFLFFILRHPMHRLNLAIVLLVFSLIQITVFYW